MSRMISSHSLHQVALWEAPVTWTQALLSSWSSNRRDTEWPARAFTVSSTASQLLIPSSSKQCFYSFPPPRCSYTHFKGEKTEAQQCPQVRKQEEEMWHSHPGSQGSVHSGHPTNSCREELEGWCHHMGGIRRVLSCRCYRHKKDEVP